MSKLHILPSDNITAADADTSAGQGQQSAACCSSKSSVVAPQEAGSIRAEDGFAGNVALVTLGCAKNQVDSEVMLGVLRGRGFRPVPDAASADLIVVNTCGFLRSAVEEGIDTILDMAKLKTTGRCRKLVVAGCMVERYRDELKISMPEVDVFLSTDEILKVGDVTETTAECFDTARRPYFLYDESMPRMLAEGGLSAFVKVAEGCNRPCTFCIIPKIRGGFRSRAIDSVVREVELLRQSGIREVNLVAQDLTAYGTDFPGNRGIKSELPELLKRLSELAPPDEQFWIRLLYAYPIGVTDELIKQLLDLPHLCRYLDLPLQHISHAVLKRMQRPLGERGTRELIARIRAGAPLAALRTTFIVGFPGETEADVDALEAFVAEGHFAHVGVFTYSQEPGTPAHELEDQVDEAVKEQRRARVMEAQQRIVSARNSSLIGTVLPVIIEGEHEETDLLLSARAEWQAPETDGGIIINEIDDAVLAACGLSSEDSDYSLSKFGGTIGRVVITETAGYDLIGRLVSCSLERGAAVMPDADTRLQTNDAVLG